MLGIDLDDRHGSMAVPSRLVYHEPPRHGSLLRRSARRVKHVIIPELTRHRCRLRSFLHDRPAALRSARRPGTLLIAIATPESKNCCWSASTTTLRAGTISRSTSGPASCSSIVRTGRRAPTSSAPAARSPRSSAKRKSSCRPVPTALIAATAAPPVSCSRRPSAPAAATKRWRCCIGSNGSTRRCRSVDACAARSRRRARIGETIRRCRRPRGPAGVDHRRPCHRHPARRARSAAISGWPRIRSSLTVARTSAPALAESAAADARPAARFGWPGRGGWCSKASCTTALALLEAGDVDDRARRQRSTSCARRFSGS